MESMLVLKNLVKRYQSFYAVDNVSFELPEGEFLTLLGPSGSGKTTTLKMVAGLEVPTSGEIWVNGKDITELPPNKRGLGMVFQNYALFPHLKVAENIEFPLKMQTKMHTSERKARVAEFLELVQLKDYGDRYPSQLSGGQQQRVALARSLINKPEVLLCDEPTGNLDSKATKDVMELFEQLNKNQNATILMVTHDAFTASYAERIIFIKDGKIFNELIKGEDTRKQFFEKIIEVQTLLGGDLNDVI